MSLRVFWTLVLVVLYLVGLMAGSKTIALAFGDKWPIVPASLSVWIPLWMVIHRDKTQTQWTTKRAMLGAFVFAWSLMFSVVSLVHDAALTPALAIFMTGTLVAVLVAGVDLNRAAK